MLSRFRGLIALGTSLAIGGCAAFPEGVVIYEPNYAQLYSQGDFEFAAQRGEIKTAVKGSPFGIADEPFADKVMAMMNGANWGPRVDYTRNPTRIPPDTSESRFHVEIVFNPAANFAARSACGEPMKSPVTATGPDVYMVAAFCFGDRLMSESAGRATGLTGPDDPRFRSLVRGVTLALIPVIDMRDVGDKSDPLS